MRLRLGSLCLAAALLSLAPRPAVAADAVSGFFSGGRERPLLVDKEHVAVRIVAGRNVARAKMLNEGEARAFKMMDLEIVLRSQVKADEEIVGYPIWFDKKLGAVGVLTHEIVVRVSTPDVAAKIRAVTGFADLTETSFKKNIFLAKFTSPMTALAAANQLYKTEGVVYAHPNFMIPKDFRGASPRGPETEPLFMHQWHLENTGQATGGVVGADIHVKDAWDVTTGDPSITVATLDGGFQMLHPDLDGAFHQNMGEIAGNGIDDDANGYIDDVSGWNFWNKSNDPSHAAVDDHGTAVAGLVGARHNGKGVTGVCPGCTILPVVVSWKPAEDAAAFYYARDAGAQIMTNSWGYAIGTPTTDVVADAIDDVAATGRGGKGAIILFAMNNINQDDCIGNQPDISSLDSVIAVSAASDQDKKVSFSAWGDCMEFLSTSYESGRPGIASTDLTGVRGYNNGRTAGDLSDLDYTNDFGGTSAATPISAGVFALMLSVNPSLTRDEALAIVLSTADKISPALAAYDPQTGFSHKYGYGRINAGRAVHSAQLFRKYTQRERSPGPARAVAR